MALSFISPRSSSHTQSARYIYNKKRTRWIYFVYIFVVVIPKKVREIREREREKEMSEWEGKKEKGSRFYLDLQHCRFAYALFNP